MFRKKVQFFAVVFNFDGETLTQTATSAGLASLTCDPYVEILSVVAL